MSTLLAFANTVADACAEQSISTVVNPATNAKFVRMVLASVDDALAHLTTLHQWEWLVKLNTPVSVVASLTDVVRVRDVFYSGRKLPYRQVELSIPTSFPFYTVSPSSTIGTTFVGILNISVANLVNVRIAYEQAVYLVNKLDTTPMPVPPEYEFGLREYVCYLLHLRHVNDSKRAQMHLQNALAQYDILKSREHANKQTFNRYTGVNR
jgi:hypothetical protein